MSLHVLAIGDTGPEIRELQRRLSAAGYAARPDSHFGPLTKAAVEAFQAAHGLDVTGEVDFQTRGAMGWPFETDDIPDTDPAPAEKLVDVSYGSGVPDYRALKAAGYTGVIPKLGAGTDTVDALAARHIADARAAGLTVDTGYVYLRSREDGAAQAKHFLDLAERFGVAIWPDIEPREPYDHERGVWPVPTDAPSLYRPVAVACLDVLRASDVAWGVYGAMYLESLNLPAWLAAKPLWCATYGPAVKVPKPWTQAAIWQHAGNVRLAGAKVDLNRVLLAGGMMAVRERMRG